MNLTPEQERRDAIFLVAIGGLVMALCGACTFNVARTHSGYGLEYFVGGIPTAGGAVVFLGGLLKLRKATTGTRRDRDE